MWPPVLGSGRCRFRHLPRRRRLRRTLRQRQARLRRHLLPRRPRECLRHLPSGKPVRRAVQHDFHPCSGTASPCFSDQDVAHCGTGCLDCRQPNATAVCGGTRAQTPAWGRPLSCPGTAGKPNCGSWDFESGTTEGWALDVTTDGTFVASDGAIHRAPPRRRPRRIPWGWASRVTVPTKYRSDHGPSVLGRPSHQSDQQDLPYGRLARAGIRVPHPGTSGIRFRVLGTSYGAQLHRLRLR